MSDLVAPAILVVGAGIVGRCVAWYLARTGAAVTVVERDSDGDSLTSRASLGVLTRPFGGSDPLSTFYRDSHHLHETVAAELMRETALDVGWRRLGGVDVAFDADDKQRLHQKLEVHRRWGCRAKWVDCDVLRRREPSIHSGALGGAWYEDDCRVDPVLLGRALRRAAEARGACFSFESSVLAISESSDVRVELDMQEERIDRHFDFAVIAAGAWSSALAQDFGVELAVRSVPGQSCHTGSAAIRSIVRYDGLHLLPTAEGAMCGGTVEEESYDAQIRVSSQRRLHRFCQRVLVETPSLTDFRVGLRPKPRRGRPVIGPLQLGSQVFVATGHYKNGVLMGPLTGQVLARWIHNGDPGREMSIFAVER